MTKIETLCEHTKIRLIAAAIGHQQCTKTAASLVPIPGGDRVIAIGKPEHVRELLDVAPVPATPAAPVDMILHCPKCAMQHVDAPEPRFADNGEDDTTWANPPHRSHLCHGCGHIWRPADIPTNGVKAIKTMGKNDTPTAPQAASQQADEIVTALYRRFKDWSKRGFGPDDVTWCEVKADVLALMAQHVAPQAATTASASAIKTWRERYEECGHEHGGEYYMEAEIVDLRATLTRAPLPAHAGQITPAAVRSAFSEQRMAIHREATQCPMAPAVDVARDAGHDNSEGGHHD